MTKMEMALDLLKAMAPALAEDFLGTHNQPQMGAQHEARNHFAERVVGEIRTNTHGHYLPISVLAWKLAGDLIDLSVEQDRVEGVKAP